MRKTLLVVLCFMVFPLVSCNNNGQVNFRFLNLQVVSVELPEFFELNQSYDIRVTYISPSNCTIFEGFDVTNAAVTERTIVAVGSELQDDACAEIPAEVDEYFKFTCLYTDTYVFRFWTGEDEKGEQLFLEVEVPVNL